MSKVLKEFCSLQESVSSFSYSTEHRTSQTVQHSQALHEQKDFPRNSSIYSSQNIFQSQVHNCSQYNARKRNLNLHGLEAGDSATSILQIS